MPARILIVEDNRDVRDLLRIALAPLYEVVEAADGLQGWQRFEQHRPHLVVTDLGMPGLNGIDLTEKIRAHAELGDVPVVILTGATAGEELDPNVWLQGTQANAFFEKPCDPFALRAEIDRLLKERAGFKELPPGKGYYD